MTRSRPAGRSNQVLDVLLGSEPALPRPDRDGRARARRARASRRDESSGSAAGTYVLPVGGSSPLGASCLRRERPRSSRPGTRMCWAPTATGRAGRTPGSGAPGPRAGSWSRRVHAAIVDPASTVRVGLGRTEVAARRPAAGHRANRGWSRDQVGERYAPRAEHLPRRLLLAGGSASSSSPRPGLLREGAGRTVVALPPRSVPHRALVFLATGGAPGPVRLALRGVAGERCGRRAGLTLRRRVTSGSRPVQGGTVTLAPGDHASGVGTPRMLKPPST